MEVFAGHFQPIHHPWIPAFAGMTNWGAGMTKRGPVAFRHTLRPRDTIFVRIVHASCRRHTKL